MHPIKINGIDTPYYGLPIALDAEKIHLYRINNESIMLTWHSPEWPLRLNNIVKVDTYTGDMEKYNDRVSIVGCISASYIDEGVKVLVDYDYYEGEGLPCYMNYGDGIYTEGMTWQQSVRSLLTHNGIEIKDGEKLLILKKS